MDKLERIELFKRRTKKFSISVIHFYRLLPNTSEYQIIGKQLIRSVTSVAANYRAACRSRSDAEFFSKISIVVEEADETLFWLELIAELDENNVSFYNLKELQKEAEEIVKITSTIRHKLKK